MKSALVFVIGVCVLQSIQAQCIRTAPMLAPVIQSNNVGTTLADTLSLLTVSSLLAEKLPFDYPCGCAPYVPPCDPYVPAYPYLPPCDPYVPAYPYLPPCATPCAPPCDVYVPPCDIYVPPCETYVSPYTPYAPAYEVFNPFDIVGPAVVPIAPVVGNCGCGCNGYGYPYCPYL